MLADPEEFRQREIWKGRIAGELDQAISTNAFGEFTALWSRPDVTPYQRGPDNVAADADDPGAGRAS